MLRLIFILLFFANWVYPLPYSVLEAEYRFKNQTIYAKDLLPDLQNNFLLFEIPKSINSYQVKSSQIVEKFANEGISVGAKAPIITFKRIVGGEIEGIRKYILAEFLREYQQNKIKVDAVHLEQITPIDFNEEAIVSIDFHSKLLKRREGSFDIVVQEKNGEKLRNRKVYFKYAIDATLQAIQTSEAISGRQSINHHNARLIRIPFERISSALMKESEMGKVAVRSYTPKDIIVTQDRLILKRVVKKGDKISISVTEEGILLEFILEAQKDGAIGDVIKARALQGKKTYEVEIIEAGRGRLL
ncbi:flagellar basal body P-ring formation chaperone FlgA [uncultured Helicobacter sp.]|uniref:flagellar basal body P-ring formation chaperone FlgA n=1 Tax=uncultured Helicobacter sp. TaxID=175537 RepID=UPI002624FAEE|nr:flagellar basal body P-ring formation chaperone FlgA [uncultured Helicobacter sp.]